MKPCVLAVLALAALLLVSPPLATRTDVGVRPR
jgi:hypothetical protein